MPPALDDRMTKNAINMLSLSPILLLANGYWMLSNKQIFASELNSLSYMNETMLTSHDMSTVFELNYAFPIVGILMAVSLIIFLRLTFDNLMHKWGFVIAKGEIKVDEDLPSFFSAVPLTESDWLMAENRNMREVYGFGLMRNEVVEQLDN